MVTVPEVVVMVPEEAGEVAGVAVEMATEVVETGAGVEAKNVGMVVEGVAAAVEMAVGEAAVVADELLEELEPQAASTNAPKLAAPPTPTAFRKRLRSVSSRTRRSTTPVGCWVDSSEPGLGIGDTSDERGVIDRPTGKPSVLWVGVRKRV